VVTLLALGHDPAATLALGLDLAARADVERCTVHVLEGSADDAPFAAVLRVDGPSLSADLVRPAADVGLYRAHERHVKQRDVTWPLGTPSPGVAAVYATRRHPSLDRGGYDRHWGDVHGPPAVRHHVGMWDYWQCVLDDDLLPGSPDFDGIAIVQFASLADLQERFFDGPEGRAVIEADAASFTDLSVLVRLLMVEHVLEG
jgi:uncharacterized protein (TIGR02118 family)